MRQRRDFDWMLTPAGYNQVLQSDVLLNDSVNIYALTTPAFQDNIFDQVGSFESSDSWTLEAVRGDLNFAWDVNEVAANWGLVCMVRLEVFQCDLNGAPMVAASYSLNGGTDANRSFLWQHVFIGRRLGSWLEPEQSDRSQVRIPVNVKTRRRIRGNEEVVALVVQWAHDGTYAGEAVPRGLFLSNLRVLGSK